MSSTQPAPSLDLRNSDITVNAPVATTGSFARRPSTTAAMSSDGRSTVVTGVGDCLGASAVGEFESANGVRELSFRKLGKIHESLEERRK